jgi:5-formyltetrahydrofolate cyclo-ligase
MAARSVDEEKQRLRVAMRARRAAIGPAVRARAAAALVAIWRRERPVLAVHAGGHAVGLAGFWPLGDEIDARPLLGALHDEGFQTALPVTPPFAGPLLFRRWAPSTVLVDGPFGTSEPAATEPALEPDVLLVPLLAVDADGFRLGYGGGYYDRTLAALRRRRAVVAIGVGFEAQQVDRVPRDAGDHRLDWLLTEARLLAFA